MMVPGNRTRLEKAGRELSELAQSKADAQTVTLAIFRTLEIVQHVLADLVFRPEVNSDDARNSSRARDVYSY